MNSALIPIMGMMIPMVIVPTALYFKHAARRRQMDHAERIRAMELGFQPASAAGSTWPAALAAGCIGVFVPLGSFAITLATVLNTETSERIWAAPVIVSVSALCVAMTILLIGQTAAARASRALERPADFAGKPSFDPESYDFAGNRG